MGGFVLRLAGPLQSWGEHSTYAVRDTQAFPTRSGLLGLFAASLGLRRGTPLANAGLDQLTLTVRIDRPGVPLADFHTVGGGYPRRWTVPTAEGGRRPEGQGTIVSRRYYLSDAAFTVGVTGPDDVTTAVVNALREPHWHPYLGRRSCPPDPPVLLHPDIADIDTELRTRVPLPAIPRHRAGTDTVEVLFVRETDGEDPARRTELADVPDSFERFNRRYGRRAVTVEPDRVSAALAHRPGPPYQAALHAYVKANLKERT